MKHDVFIKNILASALACTFVGAPALTNASSHREAPFITQSPKVDASDFYMFRSYEPGREDYVTLIANYFPLQASYGGPNYFTMDPNALYEIHIDNNGDAIEDITFQFQFDNVLQNNGAGITLNIDGKDIPVALRNISQVSSSNPASVNDAENFEVTMVSGDRRSGSKSTVTYGSGNTTFAKPYDNVGIKTFTDQAYSDYASTFIYDVTFPSCPAGSQDGKIFVGQRKDSFAVNLGEVFDLVNIDPVGPVDGELNVIDDENVTTFAVEVPAACLTNDGAVDVVAGWTTSSKRQVQVLDPTPGYKNPALERGAWTQMSRLSMPLVNELVIGLPDKNMFNSSEPKDDTQFLDYVTNPTFPAILEVLFGVSAPTASGRPDLVATFLTGLTGVNADGGVGEMQRLNVTIPVTAKDSQNNLGVAGGDNAGFPNGRRPGDDVVDITTRVAMGALCHLGLNLCTPAEALSGTLPYTDGALQNSAQFDNGFPYLTTPISSSPSN